MIFFKCALKRLEIVGVSFEIFVLIQTDDRPQELKPPFSDSSNQSQQVNAASNENDNVSHLPIDEFHVCSFFRGS